MKKLSVGPRLYIFQFWFHLQDVDDGFSLFLLTDRLLLYFIKLSGVELNSVASVSPGNQKNPSAVLRLLLPHARKHLHTFEPPF